MACTRCRGLMVPDQLLDLVETGDVSAWGWRCVSCGQIIDRVVLQNRSRSQTPQRVRAEAEPPCAVSRGVGNAA